ncbi:MAG: NADH-quinone oxidoreductase subunit NuoN [Acidimicrobiales bacterium]|nr:MAG: NADH-quinone oxidoreductase subunit NuoN [Acidimicrobiales bacterium]
MIESLGAHVAALYSAKPGSVHAPSIDYAALSPILIVLGAACLGIVVEAFSPRRARRAIQFVLAVAALLTAGAAVVWQAGANLTTASGAVAIDSAGLFFQGSIIVLGLLAVLLIAEQKLERGGAFAVQPAGPDRSVSSGTGGVGGTQGAGVAGGAGGMASSESVRVPTNTEVFPLTMFALAGMLLFVTANDLLVMFVALEVLSLPLYLLCGLARRRRLLSQEAAMKYFLLGAFASAFFLYGVALLYGYAGTVSLGGIAGAIAHGPSPTLGGHASQTLLLLGLSLLIVGLLFKAGAAPFHSWTPDVYQGAPTPITALMAACTKVAAFGAIARVLYICFDKAAQDWRPILITVAIVTMVTGAVLAITQTDIKRLLAYSSIANAGFILTGTVTLSAAGLSATMFYLVAYGFMTLGALGVVMTVRDAGGEANHISRWAGLARRSPAVAGVMTFFLLAFAGIPLTSGFTSKFAVFSAAFGAGRLELVIVGVIASMVLVFPYLRLVVLMYAAEPAADSATVQLPGGPTRLAIAVGALATLALGVAPGPLLQLASNAAHFVA